MTKTLLVFNLFFIYSLGFSQSFNLSVSNGHGSGIFSEGDTVYIWSNPEFNELVFKEWQGSAVNYMINQNEWLSKIYVPAGSNVGTLNATAQFNDLSTIADANIESIILPGLDNGVILMENEDVYLRVPQNPVGIVFCFHGTGGSGAGFENDFEKKSFFKAGTNRNYIMVATNANEKSFGDQNGDGAIRWEINNAYTDEVNNNIDIKRIKSLRDSLINRFSLSPQFPTFALGVSNGANFADLCAAALDFNASGHMTGNGHPDIYANRDDATPVIFVQSENDQHSSANPTIVIANYHALLNRGISSEFHWHTKTPVYNYRFTRTEDMMILPSISDSIYQRMLNSPGLLDQDHKLLITNNSELPADLFLDLGLNTGSINDCANQIKIMNADHKFHSHFNNRIIDFFELHNTNTSSFSELNEQNIIYLYPNPTNDRIYLSEKNEFADFKLYTTAGKLLDTFYEQNYVDLSSYPSGQYFIEIQLGNTIILNNILKY